jgi:hypothetical protein
VDVKYEGGIRLLIKRILTTVVILLFIGVGLQSAFAINPIKPDDSELEEITVQFYETDKTYNHTVMLTRGQIVELENLIDDFEIKIDNADNRLETEAIYKDTVVSLNDYGILPDGMSVEKAQRLITGKEHNPVVVSLFERWYNRNHKSMGHNENVLCFIGGYSSNSVPVRGIFTIITPIWNFLVKTFNKLGKIGPIFEEIFHEILISSMIMLNELMALQPFGIGFELLFGDELNSEYTPSHVEINTLGLNGKKTFNGEMYGQLPLPPFILPYHTSLYCFPGAIGFTGIKILDITHYSNIIVYLGSALWVKLGEEPPER